MDEPGPATNPSSGPVSGPRARGSQEHQHTLRHRLLAACAYVGPGFVLPHFSREDSAFLRWHERQGFALFFAEALAVATVVFLDQTVGRIPLLGLVVILAFEVAAFATALLLSVLGVVKTLAGEEFRLPILADYAERIPSQNT